MPPPRGVAGTIASAEFRAGLVQHICCIGAGYGGRPNVLREPIDPSGLDRSWV